MEKVLSTLFAGILVLWPLTAVSLFWLWGGIKQNALGYLAAGIFFFVSGMLFLYVDEINVYARMDNAYIGNIILGVYLFVFGGTLLLASIVGYGIRWWIALLGGLGIAILIGIFNRHVTQTISLIWNAVFIVTIFLIVAIRRRGIDAAVAVFLAILGLFILWQFYGAGTIAFIPVDSVDAVSKYKPPILGTAVFFLDLAFGVAFFVAAHFLQKLLPRPKMMPTGEITQM